MVEIRLELENFSSRNGSAGALAGERTQASRENEYLSEWMDASKDRNYSEAVLRR